MKAKPATCFALRGERFASSSRLMKLSLLGYKDGTRTIEMILVSTVLQKIGQPKEVIKNRTLVHVGAGTRNSCQCACAVVEMVSI